MLSSLSTALQQEKEFINVIWWVANLACDFISKPHAHYSSFGNARSFISKLYWSFLVEQKQPITGKNRIRSRLPIGCRKCSRAWPYCMFSRAWHWLHVFPRLASVACFYFWFVHAMASLRFLHLLLWLARFANFPFGSYYSHASLCFKLQLIHCVLSITLRTQ